jgi:hypothetical protein
MPTSCEINNKIQFSFDFANCRGDGLRGSTYDSDEEEYNNFQECLKISAPVSLAEKN